MKRAKNEEKGQPMSVTEAMEIVRGVREAFSQAMAEQDHPLDVGVGEVQSPARLIELRREFDQATWEALEQYFEITGTEAPGWQERLNLFEYGQTQRMFQHYDLVNAGIMSLLVVAGLGTWGLLLGAYREIAQQMQHIIITFELALLGVLSALIYYVSINRLILIKKFERLNEIETRLGCMDQHSRFSYCRRRRRGELMWPGGQTTQILLYLFLVALGSGLVVLLPYGAGTGVDWLSLAVGITSLVLAVWWSARCKVLVVSSVTDYCSKGLHLLWLELGGYKASDVCGDAKKGGG